MRGGVISGSDASVAAATALRRRSPHVLSQPWRARCRRRSPCSRSSRSASVRATRRTRAAPRPVSRRSRHASIHARARRVGERDGRRQRARPGRGRSAATMCREASPLAFAALTRRPCGPRPTTRRFRAGRLDPQAQVEPVEQRRRQAARVARAMRIAAAAVALDPPARARVAHATSRKSAGSWIVPDARLMRITRSSSGWRSASSTLTRELGRLVEEQHPAMGERDFARARRGLPPPTNATADAVVRRGTAAGCAGPTSRRARGRVDARDVERVVAVEVGQDRRQATGEHRLPDSGRTDQQHVVPAGRRGRQRDARVHEPLHVGEVERLVGVAVGIARTGAAPADRATALRPSSTRAARRACAPHVARRARAAPRRHSYSARSCTRRPAASARRRAQSVPTTGRTAPSSPSSPSTPTPSSTPAGKVAVGARERERDRELEARAALAHRRGARFTVTRFCGHSKPDESSAARALARLRPAASGRPTTVYPGSPRDTWTSTVTARPSTPSSTALLTDASTPRPPRLRSAVVDEEVDDRDHDGPATVRQRCDSCARRDKHGTWCGQLTSFGSWRSNDDPGRRSHRRSRASASTRRARTRTTSTSSSRGASAVAASARPTSTIASLRRYSRTSRRGILKSVDLSARPRRCTRTSRFLRQPRRRHARRRARLRTPRAIRSCRAFPAATAPIALLDGAATDVADADGPQAQRDLAAARAALRRASA